MLKVGAVKSALDIFLPLELWNEIIKCYLQIGRTEAVSNMHNSAVMVVFRGVINRC